MNLFKRKDTRECAYSLKFECRGKQYLWSTRTNDYSLAMKRAKLYRDRVMEGAFHMADAMKARGGAPTMEGLFTEYMKLSRPNDATKTRNVLSMKQVLGVAGLDYTARIDQLSKDTALAWLRVAGQSDLSKNSALRKARSLFSRDALEAYPIKVPMQLIAGFMKARYLKVAEGVIDVPETELIMSALSQLPHGPERNAFLLGIGCGLRSGEMQAARWDWIVGNSLFVGGKPAEFTAKSGKYRVVSIGDDVIRQLWRAENSPYICGEQASVAIIRHLPTMLHGYGFTQRTPVHSLRRWYGSEVAQGKGLWEASKALGHASYKTTERSYARILRPVGGIALPIPATVSA